MILIASYRNANEWGEQTRPEVVDRFRDDYLITTNASPKVMLFHTAVVFYCLNLVRMRPWLQIICNSFSEKQV